jgi:magnesium-transporting ATPase (P-type)
MRLLCLAYKPVNEDVSEVNHDDVSDMIYLGLVGIVDPPRDEVPEAIETARRAGVTTYMATGDHPDTARPLPKKLNSLKQMMIARYIPVLKLMTCLTKTARNRHHLPRICPDDTYRQVAFSPSVAGPRQDCGHDR